MAERAGFYRFRNSKGHFVGKKYRGKKRREYVPLKTKPKRGFSSKDFPSGYTSPFRHFITPIKRARFVDDGVFALVEIESRRKYEGEAIRLWVPLRMPLDNRRGYLRMDYQDVEERFKDSRLHGKNQLVQVFGLYALKSPMERRARTTKKLLALFKIRERLQAEKKRKRKRRA